MVRQEVINVVREILSDSEDGLKLTPNFARRLKRSLKDKEAGRTTPLLDALKKYEV